MRFIVMGNPSYQIQWMLSSSIYLSVYWPEVLGCKSVSFQNDPSTFMCKLSKCIESQNFQNKRCIYYLLDGVSEHEITILVQQVVHSKHIDALTIC